MKKFNTFAEAYKELLNDVYHHPEYTCSPRGQEIKEILNYQFEITDSTSCLYGNERRSSQYKYIAGELIWYFSGSNDLDFISRYANFWTKIDRGGILNSAYGHLIFKEGYKTAEGISQFKWAHDALVKDKDSRQAIMHFNTPDHQYVGNLDFVCTLYGNFHIRNNKLHFSISMRSNDAILGLPTDIAFFSILHQQMHRLLKETYPDLELGSYTHKVDSIHIYDRHFALVEDMLAAEFIPEKLLMDKLNLVDSSGRMAKEMNMLHISARSEMFLDFSEHDSLLGWTSSKAFDN